MDSYTDPFHAEVSIGPLEDATIMDAGLMDSGCTSRAFIHEKHVHSLCSKYHIAPYELAHPQTLIAFNDASVPPVTHALTLPLRVNDHFQESISFFIANCGSHDLILGKSWMHQHQFSVSFFDDGTLKYATNCQQFGCYDLSQGKPQREAQHNVTTTEGPSEDPSEVQHNAVTPRTILKKPSPPPTADVKKHEKKDPGEEVTSAQVYLIGAAPFYHLARQKGHDVFAISMKDIAAYRAKQAEPEIDPLTVLPAEYHDFVDVFTKKHSLPNKNDHAVKIELKDGAQLPRTEPLRRMSEEEGRLVEEYVRDNLAKGYISPSAFEYASPILFVRKPGGGLRLCIDYRRLNDITKKDRYPLPLIDETIARVVKAKYFTKLDIVAAFNSLRFATAHDEDLTTFATRVGNYKNHVMPFGLCNGPANWQRYINDAFIQYLGKFLEIYVDDMLIYSQTKEAHVQHVRTVLQRLRELGLVVDIKKCSFSVQEVKFLGLIITLGGCKMDPDKVAAILSWEKPLNNVRGVRQFIGFVNYYRRFIRNFSKIMRPLQNLTMKDAPPWDESCDEAFELIKHAVAEQPIMKHFEFGKQAYVETDSSDTVAAGVLSQKGDDGLLHPVAYFSKSLDSAQRNYAIYDKELLAIVKAFEQWNPELHSATDDMPIQILTDHKALEYFMSTKKLTRRQARWAEFLAPFRFKIVYRPGAKNGKADALTRRESDIIRSQGDPNLYQTLLPADKLSDEVIASMKPLEVALVTELSTPLPELVAKANRDSQDFQEIIEKGTTAGNLHGYNLRLCTTRDGLLLFKGKIAVPDELRRLVIQEIHASKELGHAGIKKTLLTVGARYQWPTLAADVQTFINNCHDCHRSRTRHEKPAGLLQPLPIPERPWTDISMDFVTGLPLVNNCNAILNIVDRLTKDRHFIACLAGEKGTTAEATAYMLYQHVWKHHGLPLTIVSDRGSQFVSLTWKHLCDILGVKVKLSTAFHPETDGQTEILNAEMERYLRTFVNENQDNWVHLLPGAEFASRALYSDATTVSPFMATHGYEPRMSFDTDAMDQTGDTARERIQMGKAKNIAAHMQKVWDTCKKGIAAAQLRMVTQANKHRSDVTFDTGDKVWLSTKNMKTQRPCKKLDYKYAGPYTVLEKKGISCRLDLPPTMKVHDVFHPSLLHLDPDDPLPGQEFPQPPPVIIEDAEQWEVDEILAVRKIRGKLEYKAKWTGYDRVDTWYPADNFMDSQDVLRDFYTRHPTKPKPSWLKLTPPAMSTSLDPTTHT